MHTDPPAHTRAHPSLRESLISILLACACVLLISLAFTVCLIGRTIASLPALLDKEVSRLSLELDQARLAVELLPDRIMPWIAAAVDRQGERAQQEIRHASDGVLGVTRGGVLLADQRIGQGLEVSAMALGAAAGSVEGLRRDLGPVLEHAGGVAAQLDGAAPLFLDCDHNPDCLFNRYVGASKGIERAALNFGAMSQEVRGALPGVLVTWDRIGANSDRATAATAKTMQNFARATKPLPAWIRIPLSITGAVAPTVAGAINAAAATGAFR